MPTTTEPRTLRLALASGERHGYSPGSIVLHIVNENDNHEPGGYLMEFCSNGHVKTIGGAASHLGLRLTGMGHLDIERR
jgi:hypothetical protein